MEQRARGIDIPLRNRIHATKASELRSQSVMTNKKLTEIDRNLDAMKMNKAFKNDASFSMIEKEKQRLNKVFQLPPIARMQSVQQSIGASSQHSLGEDGFAANS